MILLIKYEAESLDEASYLTGIFRQFGINHLLWFYFGGFNMTIVAGLFLLLFGRLLGPRRGAAAAALGIAAYTLMASLFLLARRTPGYPFSRLRV